ncbi:uncharacterized protein K02A2.6-like [Sabethes cyaneus]|uniref:uncharacterized protein K02A2.6-like n=1 Tax=Sabethes cyaneus TaxID=53552 RepID=UPI00237E88D6|nr:uncharacterized protein K02A2.6-like [Sabethes cyaneus]
MDEDFKKMFIEMMNTQQKILSELAMSRTMSTAAAGTSSTDARMESLANSMTEFHYDPESNLTFDNWYSRHEDTFRVDAGKLNDAAKTRLLLRKLSDSTHAEYMNHILPKTTRDFSFDETVSKLKQLFSAHASLFCKRYRCLTLNKKASDDFQMYAGFVNRLCEDFGVANCSVDEFKCLIYVCGLHAPQDAEIRTALLAKLEGNKSMTLNDLTTECHRIINLRKDASIVECPSEKASVNAINPNKHPKKSVVSKPAFKHPPMPNNTAHRNNSDSNNKPRTPCWKCGQLHYIRECPFQDHRCRDCNVIGHKEGYCHCVSSNPGKKRKSKQAPQTKGIYSVRQVAARDRRKYVTVVVNKVKIELQLDCASDISIITEDNWNRIGRPSTKPPSQQARTASGQPLPLIAEIDCDVMLRGVHRSGKLFITNVHNLNLLGLDFIELFNLWHVPLSTVCNNVTTATDNVQWLKISFPQLFSDSLGCCNKTEAKLYVKPDVQPVFRGKRPVPFAALEPIETELKRLEELEIISPVEFSDWAAPIVAVRKKAVNGQPPRVRVCADYSTGLNSAIQPNQHPLPLPEEIFAKLSGSIVFSHIDLSDAYLQIPVEKDSRQYLTINTHRGLFEFNRLPPGVKSAPGTFQTIVDAMVAGLEGVETYLDDVLVHGKDAKEHRVRLLKLLERIQEWGFTLRIENCSFFMPEIHYLGFIINHQGIRPDPVKTAAICSMPPPHDVSTLRSYLGAINFYAKFVRNMHDLRRPLDSLLKEDSKWNWDESCQRSFEQFKSLLRSDLLLAHYDPNLETIVAADASSHGVGACLMHRYPDGSMKVVCHASRTLTPAEQRYGQVEKEALALIFGVTKFHRFIYGRKFSLHTDHKPLVAVFGSKKGIPIHTTNRLQRWALILLSYDFDITHVATQDFGYADILSRLIDPRAKPDDDFVIASVQMEEDVSATVNAALTALPVTFKHLQAATNNDKLLLEVIQHVQTGWPKSIKQVNNDLRPFYARKEGLSLVRGCLMLSGRIVVPKVYRQHVLKAIHKGHPGQERMKSVMRSHVYWPGVDQDVQNFVSSCRACASVAKSPPKTLLSSWPQASHPWQRLHVDYAGPFEGQYFLVIVDSYSKWPEIIRTSTITSRTTIELLFETFARYGLPETIVSDNGTQFSCSQFKEFCESLGIVHIRTAPYHPQSNGQAERFVDTLKRGLRKIMPETQNSISRSLQIFLSAYRSTPNKSAPDGLSPAEILMGRKHRTTLDLLKPPVDFVLQKNQHMENQFNRHHGAKKRNFEKGDQVYASTLKHGKLVWLAGTVIERVGSVNYNVLLDGSRLIRSHTNQLRARGNTKVEVHMEEASSNHHLPLHILLQEFKFIEGSSTAADQPVPAAPRLPRDRPLVPLRRSTRIRRMPTRYNPYFYR